LVGREARHRSLTAPLTAIGLSKIRVSGSHSFHVATYLWRLRWGIDYFKHGKHEGWKLWQ
jgi:hypothetical protein